MTAIVGWAPVLASWSDCTLASIEPLIPPLQFAAIIRFRRWQDRQARLLARLILRRILASQEVAGSLDDIALTQEGRPFIAGAGDFSIAHTTTLAVCAWVPRGRVGIDVEASRTTLTLEDMRPWMSEAERRRISASLDPMGEALRLWTAKEAVCKADGCGIASGTLPDCAEPLVTYRNVVWQVHSRRRRGHAISIAAISGDPLDWRTFRLRGPAEACAGSTPLLRVAPK